MIYTSIILESASGSAGGSTFSRNAGGPYIRGRATPVNPNTPAQQAVRNAMAQLSNLWLSTLTAAQRAAWITYADNVPLPNRLGQSRNVSGIAMYVRSNVSRLQAGIPRVDDAPTIFTLGEFTDPSFAIDTASDEVDVTFTDTDDWANEDDSSMLVYASVPKNPTIEFYKGGYELIGTIDGDAVTAPTSPAAIALPQAIVAGQRNFFRVRVSRADGRLSPDFRGFGDAA